MSATESPKVPRMRHARKSIAHVPSTDTIGNKENVTVDAAAIKSFDEQEKHKSKKTRSKSLGPGGLDALKEDSGNKQPTLPPYVKSILKPTISLSPPKAIPPHHAGRKASPSKTKGPKTPEKSPRKSPTKSDVRGSRISPGNIQASPKSRNPKSQSPSRSPARIAVRSEEEQQTAAREREKLEILAHKDARRKSLANRRVSFAPEATLHTWNVVELPEDSTTSSANSTRRASGLTANAGSPYKTPRSPMPSSEGSEPPSTPPEQAEELQVAASPAHQRDLHQKKRRRSSGIPPMNFNNPEDFSSSPCSGADDDTNQSFVTAEEIDKDSDSSSKDDDLVEDETITGVDGEDNTLRSMNSNSTGSSGRLEAALQQAANQAGTQGIDYDEHGDIKMEMADEEVTNAFKPWLQQGKYVPQIVGDPSALQDQENLNPFSPAFKANVSRKPPQEDSENEDGTMEMTQAIGSILPSAAESQGSPKRRKRKSVTGNARRQSNITGRRSSGGGSASGDETMDLTMAVGGIQQGQSPPGDHNANGNVSEDEDEELTMEFTSVIGGMVQPAGPTDDQLANQQLLQDENRRDSANFSDNDETMDITYAAGGILPSIAERTEPIEDQTQDMDITKAVGEILPQQLNTSSKTEAKALMEQETDVGQLGASPFLGTPRQEHVGVGLTDERPLPGHVKAVAPEASPFGTPRQKPVGVGLADERPLPGHVKAVASEASPFGTSRQKPVGVGLADERPLPGHVKAMASETGSPSLATSQTWSQPRKSAGGRASVTPKSQQPTPARKPNTPSKQLTPQPARPITPGKTPPSKNVSMRSASPKKLFKSEIRAETRRAPDPISKPADSKALLQTHATIGACAGTPSIVLKPKRRRSSGLGIDREGLGSPHVTALLDRRVSIGKQAKAFVAQSQASSGVRFEDPQIMEQQLDQERAEDQRKESGRGILEDEADTQDLEEKDATTSLKDRIESLTPQKKNKLKGRKSLHVGAARGLLGKRPAELDDDESEDDTSKRLRGREGSPVKKVKLPAPPSKTATIGRSTRSSRLSLADTSGNARIGTPLGNGSPTKPGTTPKDQPRFKDVESDSFVKVPSFEEKLEAKENGAIEPLEEEQRIRLQDFLNMTSIRFMELTTTKRRHTIAPNPPIEANAETADEEAGKDAASKAFESCVVAGACTVPMLELYQHSCRELKSYISEGRSIVKDIETETYDENPPLFREYLSAPPDVKSIMDNQFKNVKTHARLLSKAMWYEWRMKLLDGLKEGLLKIGGDMDGDDRLLTQQEQIIQPVLPGMIDQHEQLEVQLQIAREQADELAQCDQEELKDARESLASVDQDLESKQKLIEELQAQLRDKEDHLGDIIERKQECIEDIKEAERVREECRGWSSGEVAELQANVSALEKTYGWTITSTLDSSISMTYKRTLQLFFTPTSFKTSNSHENTPISLTYIADSHAYHPQPLTTEKRFFLQIMRAQLQCLQQSATTVRDLLTFVSTSWEHASTIAEEARKLGVSYITEPTITSDEVMAVRSFILLQAMRTKVEVVFEVKVRSGDGVAAFGVGVKSSAKVCYGEGLKEKKMAEFLESRIKGNKERGAWVRAVGELEDRLRARGRKT